jgi:hypothetical protein
MLVSIATDTNSAASTPFRWKVPDDRGTIWIDRGLKPQSPVLRRVTMGRGILLWLLGVPIPVIILLWLFFGH